MSQYEATPSQDTLERRTRHKLGMTSRELFPFNLYAKNHVSYRLYRDTRPRCLETAPLQKGLVVLFDGKELIEEGVGFGVPVLKYKDKTYFSSSAQSFLFYDEKKQPILTKSFNFDAISRKRLGSNSYVNDALYRLIHRVFEKAYLGYKGLAPAMNAIMELRTRLKIQTDFIKVESRGTVDVAYTCRPDAIEVSVDFSEAKKEDCCEILILNEQGASSFSEYSDTDGLSLSGRGIGAWEEVNAQEATLSDKEGRLGFTLRKTETAELFRGWERTRGRFSWSGLSYSLPPSVSTFNFVVELNEPP